MDLDVPCMTALHDLFALHEGAVSVYVVLMDESLHKSWIQINLKDMNFPGESRLVYSETSYTLLILCSQIYNLKYLQFYR